MNVRRLLYSLLLPLGAVALAARFDAPRWALGTQADVLPALMVYFGLRGGVTEIALAACLGGAAFDAVSANPPGAAILPLFLIGFALHEKREFLAGDQAFVQCVLGAAASALAPIGQWTILSLSGRHAAVLPEAGFGIVFQGLGLTAVGAAATPLLFWALERREQPEGGARRFALPGEAGNREIVRRRR